MERIKLFTASKVFEAVCAISTELQKTVLDKQEDRPLFCIILKGGFKFGSELLRTLSIVNIDPEITFINCKSYYSNHYPGDLEELTFADPINVFKDRNVILIDDILDTGQTMNTVISHIENLAKSINVVVLINKTASRKENINHPVIRGFDVQEDLFLLGYGMGDGELYRNENYISYYKER